MHVVTDGRCLIGGSNMRLIRVGLPIAREQRTKIFTLTSVQQAGGVEMASYQRRDSSRIFASNTFKTPGGSMSYRDHMLTVMLWLAIIGMGSWAGGTLYQMVEVVPIWSASPPESVRTFFRDTDFGRRKVRFFGPSTMVARNLPLVLALVAAWPRPRHRAWLLLAISCFAFGLVLTLAYVYPINAVLFDQAGGSATDGEISSMVSRWILADRVRFGVGLVGLFAVLQAFRLPIGSPAEVSQRTRSLS
jgi:hypothetical protein